jgi:hypothetical protein
MFPSVKCHSTEALCKCDYLIPLVHSWGILFACSSRPFQTESLASDLCASNLDMRLAIETFTLPLLEEILEVPGGLVQVENQGKGHVGASRGAPLVATGRR